MAINCRKCGKEIPVENINFEKQLAKCSKCHTIFFVNTRQEGLRPEPKISHQDLSKTKGITVKQEKGTLLIERQWSRFSGYLLITFSILWIIASTAIILPFVARGMNAAFIFLIPLALSGFVIGY